MTTTAALKATLERELDEAGLSGSFLVLDLHTDAEIVLSPEARFPLASLVKVPLAATLLEAIDRGDIDPTQVLFLEPAQQTPGPTGTCLFQRPAQIAVEDLIGLALTISDDTAADALFQLCPPSAVNRLLRSVGITSLTVRHTIAELHHTIATMLPREDRHLALTLAISSSTGSGGHLIPQLDNNAANVGTARGLAQLLRELWLGSQISGSTRHRVRDLMGRNVIRHRLTPEFASDQSKWFSKTGTFLHLRHEMGVVEHADGTVIAVVALTASRVPATEQPLAEQIIGSVARRLHDRLRERSADHTPGHS